MSKPIKTSDEFGALLSEYASAIYETATCGHCYEPNEDERIAVENRADRAMYAVRIAYAAATDRIKELEATGR